ncbi:hypothetical protein BKP35_07080 [Anaerobacillus arseniciselenatis]|uniref:Tyr recombinase domain-containing protein n=1 Tax=Anaerobacillus arseniciselenatis TaxID=85682 RepID=A0A1S2LRG2_9BACI|nr:site-specific integrase [Anaerobacillus arseniciselenatis]OIJ14257.1 hypothetical protein BKP35_07080 [Anaerobacillus arseniciselenatis]
MPLQITPITFDQFTRSCFIVDYSQKTSLSTLKVSQICLEKHILPFFGHLLLHEITEKHLTNFYQQKKQGGYSDATIRRFFSVLLIIFRTAVNKGYLENHPMKGMIKKVNEVSKRTFIPFSNTELGQLLEVAKQEGVEMMYEFVLCTGLRLGEILALSWSDIDFKKGTCTVSKSVSPGGKAVEDISKLTRGFRTIKLSQHLLSKLEKHKEKQQEMKELFGEFYYHDLDFVFPKKDGSVQFYHKVTRQFNQLVEKANVRKMTFHDLRRMHLIMLNKAEMLPIDFLEYPKGNEINPTTKYYVRKE